MKRRLLAAALAVVLAAVGGLMLLRYVSAADQRALAGVQTQDVLVLTQAVAKGTPSEQLLGSISRKALPAIAVVPGTVTRLDELAGKVATVDLEPGEQLMASRFVDPATLLSPDEITVPEGLQQLTLLLDNQRALGGTLEAGTKVGVFLSYKEPDSTYLTVHDVLVTKIAGRATPVEGDGGSANAPQQLMVTLASTGANLEKIVFAAEHGTVWLSSEPENADKTGTQVQNKARLFR